MIIRSGIDDHVVLKDLRKGFASFLILTSFENSYVNFGRLRACRNDVGPINLC